MVRSESGGENGRVEALVSDSPKGKPVSVAEFQDWLAAGRGIEGRYFVCPPAVCRILKTFNTANYRNLSATRVDWFVRVRAAGHWIHESGEAITLARPVVDKPVLINGQHRIEAGIVSGLPFGFFVVKNVDPRAKITTDTVRARRAIDAARNAGMDVSPVHVAISNMLLEINAGVKPISPTQKILYLAKIVVAVKDAEMVAHRTCRALGEGKVKVATPVAAAMAAALRCGTDGLKINKLFEIVRDGVWNPEAKGDGAAHEFRDWLLRGAPMIGWDRKIAYAVAESAIAAYCTGRKTIGVGRNTKEWWEKYKKAFPKYSISDVAIPEPAVVEQA